MLPRWIGCPDAVTTPSYVKTSNHEASSVPHRSLLCHIFRRIPGYWETITPSYKLEFHHCHGNRKCARLLLPLDWLNDTRKDTVAIAIIKLPAVVAEDDPSFGGTIFAQPGGPAVSGTSYGLSRAPKLQEVFDIPGKKHYEILSFDGRGVGHSTPTIDCFAGVNGHLRDMSRLANGAVDLSPAALAWVVASAKADGQRCEEVYGDYLEYVGTPNVARDMVGMLDKIDELRRSSKEVERLELRKVKDVPRLNYIGISYGTVLGNTFASMFPGRVGRMILDGVCNANDFMSGLGWLTNTNQVDEMGFDFFKGCFEAGPKVCPLRDEKDSSSSDISERVWSWINSLDESPLKMPTTDGTNTFIRSGDIRTLFRWTMYDANYLYRPFSAAIADAMKSNTKALFDWFYNLYGIDPNKSACSNSTVVPIIAGDQQSAIICVDGEDTTQLKLSDWRNYLKQQLSVSSIAGAFWATLRISCAGWTARPNWLFRGPYTTPEPSKSAKNPEHGKPAAPLFFTSTSHDPATPPYNAREMAKGHPGAGVMIQKSAGHCIVLGPMGPCAKNAMANYFDTGEVPSEELVCSDTRGPWEEDDEASEYDATRQVRRSWVI